MKYFSGKKSFGFYITQLFHWKCFCHLNIYVCSFLDKIYMFAVDRIDFYIFIVSVQSLTRHINIYIYIPFISEEDI